MASTAAQLAVRLDRLPMTRHIRYRVTLISIGGFGPRAGGLALEAISY